MALTLSMFLNAANATPAQPVIPPQVSASTDNLMPQPPIPGPVPISPVPQIPSGPTQRQVEEARFTPLSATPAQSAAQTGLPIPQRQDYQAHGLHRVLNAIAGGFAGAAGHPEVGNQLAQRPYENAIADWQRKTGQLKTASDIDTELQRQGVQKAVAQTGAEYKSITAEQNQQKVEEQARKDRETAEAKAANLQARIDKAEADRESAEKRAGMHAKFAQALLNAQTPEQKEAVRHAYMEESSLTEAADINKAVNKDAALTHERATNPETPVAAARTAGARAGATTTAQIDAKTTDDAIAKQKKLKEAMTGAQEFAKRSQQSQAASEKAKIALDQYPRIMDEIETASDKPFGDRFKDFMTGTIGTEAEFAPLRLDVGLLQSLVAQIHVQRTGAVILQKFEGLFNAKQMDRATLKASLTELKYWLAAYAKNPNAPAGGDLDKGRVPGVTPMSGSPTVHYPGMDAIDPSEVTLHPRQ